MAQRFRFSLKWLLIAFTVLSVGFYLLFVRPTVIANQFIAAVERGDYEAAESLCTGDDPHFLTNAIKKLGSSAVADVELAPQSWQSIFHGRRMIDVFIISVTKFRKPFSYGSKASGVGIQVAAGVSGVYRVSETFQKNTSERMLAIFPDLNSTPPQ